MALDSNPRHLHVVQQACEWPQWIEDTYANIATPVAEGPKLLGPTDLMKFLQSLVYYSSADTAEIRKKSLAGNADPQPTDLVPINPLPTNALDLQWKFDKNESPDNKGIYHIIPGEVNARRIRGIWLELMLALFDSLDCMPHHINSWFDAFEYYYPNEAQDKTGKKPPVKVWCKDATHCLEWCQLKTWMKDGYLEKVKNLNLQQFQRVVNVNMLMDIPNDCLAEKVFNRCPHVENDSSGELRSIADLGWGLKLWMGAGLWKRGCAHLVDRMGLSPGMRRAALVQLDEEFQTLCEMTESQGVIGIHQVMYLLKRLEHPGLDANDMKDFIKNQLELSVPEAQVEDVFNHLDLNGDGVLQWQEFVPGLRFLLTNYFPHVVLHEMHLSGKQIAGIMVAIVLNVLAAYAFITIIFVAFTDGEGLASAMHSTLAAGIGAYQHLKSDVKKDDSGTAAAAASAYEGIVSVARQKLLELINLPKNVCDRLGRETGIEL
eukprot:gnl/TRDRNA2_/TRDRNA2_158658_c3_seq2.p1 gnl/TRDRNA2_/TRDRNA2_158658_c3~~gnl/TRDRNA2_/TRDRNA2_158658_c3_seq2.p1  ORF type:complete len:548 (+),score=96.27 gnl/TRDRNA2_/TRDRNA2_158658_c3_seq2:178-1644(+)